MMEIIKCNSIFSYFMMEMLFYDGDEFQDEKSSVF